jgi:hypothetical protein
MKDSYSRRTTPVKVTLEIAIRNWKTGREKKPAPAHFREIGENLLK